MRNREETCKTCRWWDEGEADLADDPPTQQIGANFDRMYKDTGYCRAQLPRACAPGLVSISPWPITRASDWCSVWAGIDEGKGKT